MTRGGSADGALIVVLSEVSNKISGGKVTSVGFLAAPVNEQAVGPGIEDAVEPDGGAAAEIVVARSIEAGVQPSLNGPVLDVSKNRAKSSRVAFSNPSARLFITESDAR